MIKLRPDRQQVLDARGHVLIRGGPGSGKTTTAVLKADHHTLRGHLVEGQSVLFLSFARATVARVRELAGELISTTGASRLELSTYHGFAWNLLRSHGYLLNGKRRIRLLPPPEASAYLADVTDEAAQLAEMRRLFRDEGVLHFDLFAELAAELLHTSSALRRIVTSAYPIIVLDEFQDTNAAEWRMIQALGTRASLVALADADQRIYEFRGADPKRVDEFVSAFQPTEFDFGGENNRSVGTDIVAFGNDLLVGSNRGQHYSNVIRSEYRVLRDQGVHLDLKLLVFQAIKRLQQQPARDWSLAVLVPTNQLMMEVSTYLGQVQRLKGGKSLGDIRHDVAFDSSGPSLAAAVIATGLEGGSATEITYRLHGALRDHMRGRKAGPSKLQLDMAGFLETYDPMQRIRGSARQALIEECQRIADEIGKLQQTGSVENDWLAVRKLFDESSCPHLTAVATDAKFLRLLHRGSALRSRLSERWRQEGTYADAVGAVRDALLQEHFGESVKRWKGTHVMTIHKAKGKEFDEVIVYEGVHRHRFVSKKASAEDVSKARRNLRVAATRARQRATFLTPSTDPCPLL